MRLEALVKLRPFVYHTTSAANLDRIRSTRELQCARRLFELAGGASDPRISERRSNSLQLQLGSQPVMIRDQRPLQAGAIAFEPGWDLPRFVEYLNTFVFFWPGDDAGPIPMGQRHFERYSGEREALAVLRVPTRDLFEHNQQRPARFSRCNSGSARCNRGEKLPRGGTTFCAADAFAESPAMVKEIVLEGHASLPPTTRIAESFAGPWLPL